MKIYYLKTRKSAKISNNLLLEVLILVIINSILWIIYHFHYKPSIAFIVVRQNKCERRKKMSYSATVFTVFIASPSDVIRERE